MKVAVIGVVHGFERHGWIFVPFGNVQVTSLPEIDGAPVGVPSVPAPLVLT